MATRTYVLAGLGVLGLLGYMGIGVAGGEGAVAELMVADLDEDQVPDRLWLAPKEAGGLELRLDSTGGQHTHGVMSFPIDGEVSFAPASPGARSGGEGSWALQDAEGRRLATISVGRTVSTLPRDLVVLAGNEGKRYHWIDRGFLKLDAHTVIPGFSVGLLMIGDPAAAMGLIGEAPSGDGLWRTPLNKPLEFRVWLSEGRIKRVRYDSSRMHAMGGHLRLGMPVSALEATYEGQREGNRYISARYGLIAELDASRRSSAFTIARPWTNE